MMREGLCPKSRHEAQRIVFTLEYIPQLIDSVDHKLGNGKGGLEQA